MRKTSNLDQAFIGTLWCENIIHKHSLWAEGESGQLCMSWVLFGAQKPRQSGVGNNLL